MNQSPLPRFTTPTGPARRATGAAVRWSLLALPALLSLGCTPLQEAAPAQECFDANVNLVALADEPFTEPVPETPAIDSIVQDYLGAPQAPPGCAIGVVTNNEVYFLKGYGDADVASSTPYTHATMQGVGSVSKTITTLAVLKLLEQGHLALGDQANQHLPFPHFNLLGVTIHDLLSHQSGLPTWPQWETDLDTEQELQQLYPNLDHPGIQPRLVQQAYNSTATSNLASGDGLYSNTGFSTLGAIVDHITSDPDFDGKQGYEAYTFWNVGLRGGFISSPTMTSLCLDTYWREDDIANLATGYLEDGATPHPNETNPNGGPGGWRGPAGGWAMTIGDLSRLMLGINTNRFVSAANKAQMLAPDIDPPSGDHTFGLGLLKLENLNEPSLLHPGNIDGFTARWTLWPEQNFGVAVMCNRENAPGIRGLTNAVAGLFLGRRSGAPRSPRPSEGESQRQRALLLIERLQAFGADAGPSRLSLAEARLLRTLESGNVGGAVAMAERLVEQRALGGETPSADLSGLDEVP